MSAAKKAPLILWWVRHPEEGLAIVDAPNWEQATEEAARWWEVPWGKVAALCECERKEEVPRHVCVRCGRIFNGDGIRCTKCEVIERDLKLNRKAREKKTIRAWRCANGVRLDDYDVQTRSTGNKRSQTLAQKALSMYNGQKKIYTGGSYMELAFMNDVSSIDRLDEIMNSYPGRSRGTIMADQRSVSVMLSLLLHRKIVITEHTYPYDSDILNDSEMMTVYTELARETRWRKFEHTEIERIRINALRQMRQEGVPFYDGDFICYREGRICAHCGNLHLDQLLMYLAAHEQVEQLCIFTYPYWTEDHTAKFYRFHLTGDAITEAGIYRESIWDKMRRAAEIDGVIPTIPKEEDRKLSK